MGVAVGLALITFGVSLVTSFPFDLYWVAFLVIFPIAGSWGWRRYSIGTVELNDNELAVRSRAQTQIYPWSDIVSIRATTLREANAGRDGGLFRVMGIDMSRPIALIELKRGYRQSLIRARVGTRMFGIPRGRRVSVEPEDVEGFVEVAKRHLIPNGTEEGWGLSRLA